MGRSQSSTRLEADFGGHPYHVPDNACVLIDASTNFDSAQSSETLAFVVNDVVGSWGSWDIVLPLLGTHKPCMLQLTESARYYSSTSRKPPYDTFPTVLDLSHTTSLSIQKPYAVDTVLNGPVEVSIRDITVYPDDGKNCTTYSSAASCRPK